MLNIAIIVAAGNSLRFNQPIPKQYYLLHGKAVLWWTLQAFLASSLIHKIVVVINKNHQYLYNNIIHDLDKLITVFGGSSRSQSVYLGLKSISDMNPDNVIIHDAARPLVSTKLIDTVIQKLRYYQAIDSGIIINDTVKLYNHSNQVTVLDRSKLYSTQTPQGFHYKIIFNLHQKSQTDYTDDISLCIKNNIKIYKIMGDQANIKITNEYDALLCEKLISNEKIYRTGIGVDIHKYSRLLKKKTKIKVCGIDIEHNKSIIAHSDGDVGIHAIAESLLGSMSLGNIGQLFPSSDKKYQDINSIYFLEYTKKKLKEVRATISNIDFTIICEQPMIMVYSEIMCKNIARILDIHSNQVSIKATTAEKIGFLGATKAIAAQAVCSVYYRRINYPK